MDKKLLIAKPVTKELEKFIFDYTKSISSDNIRIQEIIDYTMKSDGKKIRPILTLLAAKASGEINETTYLSAITIELLHTASLIHDDVVDESKIRRGMASLNAVYDNKMAILCGDYFLSTALIKSVLTGNLDIISDVSSLGRNLAEGELNQLSLAKQVILDEDQYFEVIKKKTASLFSICMKVGVLSVCDNKQAIDTFSQIGENLGVCFQIKDDIFDYYNNNVGKPTGNDIREGKVTLPLLYALRNADKDESAKMLDIIKKEDFTLQNIEVLISFAKKNGGIDYAYEKIENYKQKAVKLIDSIQNLSVKEALINACEYVVDRVY